MYYSGMFYPPPQKKNNWYELERTGISRLFTSKMRRKYSVSGQRASKIFDYARRPLFMKLNIETPDIQ